MDNDGVFSRALDTVFQGAVFLPAGILGARRLFSPPRHVRRRGLPGRDRREGPGAEALDYICQGFSNAVIAHKMGVAESTLANEYNPSYSNCSMSPIAPA